MPLFITEGVDGVELGSTRSRIEAGGEADKDGEGDGGENEPPGYGRKFDGIQILALEIDVCTERKCAADAPAEKYARDATEETHYAGFNKEKLLHVRIGSTERFQHADFSTALEDGHDQGVDDAESGDREGQTAKNSKKQIEDREKGTERLAGIEKRESAEAHRFNRVF